MSYDTWKTTPPDEPEYRECGGCDGEGKGCRRCGNDLEECCCRALQDKWVCDDCEGSGEEPEYDCTGAKL